MHIKKMIPKSFGHYIKVPCLGLNRSHNRSRKRLYYTQQPSNMATGGQASSNGFRKQQSLQIHHYFPHRNTWSHLHRIIPDLGHRADWAPGPSSAARSLPHSICKVGCPLAASPRIAGWTAVLMQKIQLPTRNACLRTSVNDEVAPYLVLQAGS